MCCGLYKTSRKYPVYDYYWIIPSRPIRLLHYTTQIKIMILHSHGTNFSAHLQIYSLLYVAFELQLYYICEWHFISKKATISLFLMRLGTRSFCFCEVFSQSFRIFVLNDELGSNRRTAHDTWLPAIRKVLSGDRRCWGNYETGR